MTLHRYSLTALELCGCLIAINGIAAAQQGPFSVALDALGTAQQMANEGRLRDALNITHLVQKLPDLSDLEKRTCRGVLERCQSLAINMYVDQSASIAPPSHLRHGMREPATRRNGDGSIVHVTVEPPPESTLLGDVPSSLPDESTGEMTFVGQNQPATVTEGFSTSLPRLLHESLETLPASVDSLTSFEPSGHSSYATDETSSIAMPRAALLPLGHLADGSVRDAPSTQSADSPSAQLEDLVLDLNRHTNAVDAVQLRFGELFSQKTTTSAFLVFTLLAGAAIGSCFRTGLRLVLTGREAFRYIANAAFFARRTRPFKASSNDVRETCYHNICASIADDNRRLR